MKRRCFVFLRSVFFFILLQTLVTAFGVFSSHQTTYNIITNRLYTTNSLLLHTNRNTKELISHLNSLNCRVFAEIDENTRFVLYDNTNWSPPLLSGYYPIGSVNNYYAVVGNNRLNDATTIDGIRYYVHKNQKFEIVGIIGLDRITYCDNLVLLFGSSLEEDIFDYSNIIVDANTKFDINKAIDAMRVFCPDVYFTPNKLTGSARIASTSFFNKYLLIELSLLVISGTVTFVQQQFNRKTTIRHLQKIVGNSPLRILIVNICETGAANILAGVFVLILTLLCHLEQFVSYKLTLISCSLTFLISTITLVFLQLTKSCTLK